MRLEDACTATFARHETFHPRLQWFRKGFLASSRDQGDFFLSEDAPVRLGVGKNMVRSIRFWSNAAHLTVDVRHPYNSRINRTMPTNLGVGLLGPLGADPQMEDPATWWWLHWIMMSPGSMLPVWWILLNGMNAVEFNDELANRVVVEALEASTWDLPQQSSIHKDVSAFLRTYSTPILSNRGKFDDQFGCPLRELRLVTPSPTGYRLATGAPRYLPGAVALAALLDFAAVTHSSSNTVAISRLVSDAGSPGRVLRLNEETLMQLIEPIIAASRDLTLTSPAGATQLGWRGDPSEIAHRLLCEHYEIDDEIPALAGQTARNVSLDLEIAVQLVEQARAVVL